MDQQNQLEIEEIIVWIGEINDNVTSAEKWEGDDSIY